MTDRRKGIHFVFIASSAEADDPWMHCDSDGLPGIALTRWPSLDWSMQVPLIDDTGEQRPTLH